MKESEMTVTASATTHFFVSYQQDDAAWAEWLAATLNDAGYSVVLQAWDFRPGQNFVLEMQHAASQAERTIAVLSPSFLRSRFTSAEWAAAFAQDPLGEQRKLVPVRVEECRPEGLLGQIIYIDLVGKDEAAARAALLSGLRESGRPTERPRFPGAQPAPPASHRESPFPGAVEADELTRPPATVHRPSRSTALRQQLQRKLRIDSDLMAFCLDHFPEVHRRFASGMDRTQKESLLLELVDMDAIAEALRTYA